MIDLTLQQADLWGLPNTGGPLLTRYPSKTSMPHAISPGASIDMSKNANPRYEIDCRDSCISCLDYHPEKIHLYGFLTTANRSTHLSQTLRARMSGSTQQASGEYSVLWHMHENV